jgi:hypothetical protein
LGRSRSSPFPIAFSISETLVNAIFAPVLVWFDHVRDNEFAGEGGFAPSPEGGGSGGKVLYAEFISGLRDGVCELAGEDIGVQVAVVVDVVFTEARVDTADDVVEVFVDEHRGCAEDDEVEVEDGEGVVEVRLG